MSYSLNFSFSLQSRYKIIWSLKSFRDHRSVSVRESENLSLCTACSFRTLLATQYVIACLFYYHIYSLNTAPFYSSGSSGLLSSLECFSFSVRMPGFFFKSPFLHKTISWDTKACIREASCTTNFTRQIYFQQQVILDKGRSLTLHDNVFSTRLLSERV